MKFGENLQNLRKEKKLSQEQLAEQLGVTRQSVSKWESNVSYPEMDKLISICKIFNCDLDVLINKDIKEEMSKKDASSVIKSIFRSAATYIEKTVRLFEQKSFKEIVKIVAQIILILIVLLLFNIPFQIIEEIVSSVFYTNNIAITNFFRNFWHFLFNTIYIVLAIITFFYVFKIKFLDDVDDIEFISVNNEKESIEGEEVKEEKIVYKKQKSSTKVYPNISLLDILVKLITFGIKFCLLMFLIPVVMGTVFLIIGIVIALIFIFKGIFIFGPILVLVAGTVLGLLIIDIILKFVFDLKINKKRSIITMLVSLVLGAVGLGFSIWYFMNLTIVDDTPSEFKTRKTNQELVMSDDFKFHQIYEKIEYEVDEELNDKVIVSIKHSDKYENVKLINENGAYLVEHDFNNRSNNKELLDSFITNLKEKKLYTYSNRYSLEFVVKSSQDNINKIRSNQDNFNY